MKKIYFNKQDKCYRNLRDFVKENHLTEYEFRSVTKCKPLTEEEFKEILEKTTDGVEEILATRSAIYGTLSQTIQFDDLTIKELYALIKEYPYLLKSPITALDNSLYIGYNQEDIGTLYNRKQKKHRYLRLLERSVEQAC